MASSSSKMASRTFLMEWEHQGPRKPAKDAKVHDVRGLWRIWNKYTFQGKLYYKVQYWEDGDSDNLVHAVPVVELEKAYPGQVNEWEDKYGDSWKLRYPGGNFWEIKATASSANSSTSGSRSRPSKVSKADSSDEDEGGARLTDDMNQGRAPKRRLNDSPHVSRQPVKSMPSKDSDEDDEIEDSHMDSGVLTRAMVQRKVPKYTYSKHPHNPLRPRLQRPAALPSGQTLTSQAPRPQPVTVAGLGSLSRPASRPNATSGLNQNRTMGPSTPRRGETPVDDRLITPQRAIFAASPSINVIARMRCHSSSTIRQANDDGQESDEKLLSIYAESQREFEAGEHDVAVDEDADTAPITGEYEEFSDLLIEAHGLSLFSLVVEALKLPNMPCGKWVRKRKADSGSYWALIPHLVVMMLGADPLILEHVVKGDLCEAAVSDPSLGLKLRTLLWEGNKEKRPAIYAQYLVDQKGISPTPKLLLEALNLAEQYVDTKDGSDKDANKEAYRIDGVIGNGRPRPNGDRKYISGGQEDVALRWIRKTRDRLASLPHDEPLKRPLAEVGYATCPDDRLKAHKMHNSSNYLMNLLEAIFARTSTGKFSIKQYVVHTIVHPSHAMYAEIIYSRIGLVYINQGGGFSHHPAGISHPGADRLSNEYYEDAQKVLYRSHKFKERKEQEVEKQTKLAELAAGILAFDECMQNLNEDKRCIEKVIEEELEPLEKEVQAARAEADKAMEPLMRLLNFDPDAELS